jgi:hypothetical protein
MLARVVDTCPLHRSTRVAELPSLRQRALDETHTNPLEALARQTGESQEDLIARVVSSLPTLTGGSSEVASPDLEISTSLSETAGEDNQNREDIFENLQEIEGPHELLPADIRPPPANRPMKNLFGVPTGAEDTPGCLFCAKHRPMLDPMVGGGFLLLP